MFSLFEGLGYWKHAYDLGCHMLKDSAFGLGWLATRVIAIAFDQLNLGRRRGSWPWLAGRLVNIALITRGATSPCSEC